MRSQIVPKPDRTECKFTSTSKMNVICCFIYIIGHIFGSPGDGCRLRCSQFLPWNRPRPKATLPARFPTDIGRSCQQLHHGSLCLETAILLRLPQAIHYFTVLYLADIAAF